LHLFIHDYLLGKCPSHQNLHNFFNSGGRELLAQVEHISTFPYMKCTAGSYLPEISPYYLRFKGMSADAFTGDARFCFTVESASPLPPEALTATGKQCWELLASSLHKISLATSEADLWLKDEQSLMTRQSVQVLCALSKG
jgi:hypothetical protein